MGAADVVPGVSGGTVALLTGIYDRLIGNIGIGSHSLGRLVRADLRGTISQLGRIEWGFLVPLGVGLHPLDRSEVCRVGKECRHRWAPYH